MNRYITRYRFLLSLVVLAVIALAGLVLSKFTTNIERPVAAETVYISQDISEAEFTGQEEFFLNIEQDDDTPFKILDAKVSLINGDQYEELTSQRAAFNEIISVPQVTLQNVSDKTVTGVTLMISDKAANTKRGFYFKKQSIRPGQRFIIRPENFVQEAGTNPAKNPKFWLNAMDKSQVTVRVVAFFEGGTMWANKNQRY